MSYVFIAYLVWIRQSHGLIKKCMCVFVCFKPKTHCTIFTKDWHCETIVAMMPVFVWDSQKSCSVSLAFGTDQQISIFFSSDPCISPEQLNMQTNAILNSQRTVCVCVCVCWPKDSSFRKTYHLLNIYCKSI